MTLDQISDGISYAENVFRGKDSHLNLDKRLIREILNFNGKKILDFGCGMGGMTLWYAHYWTCEVTGIDIDPNHIAIAEKLKERYNVENARFELRNVLESPMEEKFDYIILNNVAEHIPLDLLEKILLQLKQSLYGKGGIFISYSPWEGPYASQLYPETGFPWSQFLPEFLLRSILKNRNKILVGTKNLLQEYDSLNHLNHRILEHITKKIEMRIDFRKSHSKLNRIRGLKNINFNFGLFKYFITKELVILKAS